jgi:hypothetical protein
MSDPREKNGMKLLRALKREKDAGRSLLNCRPISAIAAEFGLSELKFEQAIAFLIEKRAINAADRTDGKAVLPSAAGEALLSSKNRESAWTMDRRLTLYGIVLAILTFVIVLLERCGRR